MSQHHLGLHKIQLVFHFCLYMPCDTKCRTFFRMAQKFRKFCRRTPALEFLFNKVAGLKACNFFKKRLQHRCYLVKLAKYSRTLFSQNTFLQCLLQCVLRKILVRNNLQIPSWQATTLPRNSLQRFPWEFFETVSTPVSAAFMGYLKFWTIVYLCSIVNKK